MAEQIASRDIYGVYASSPNIMIDHQESYDILLQRVHAMTSRVNSGKYKLTDKSIILATLDTSTTYTEVMDITGSRRGWVLEDVLRTQMYKLLDKYFVDRSQPILVESDENENKKLTNSLYTSGGWKELGFVQQMETKVKVPQHNIERWYVVDNRPSLLPRFSFSRRIRL
jgi:hypothetical protein